MIKSLLVKNFALVEEQKIEFYNNYSAFTGETGAGKSVLFEAIDFLLGKKGDVKSIRFGAEKAIVEGEFLWEGEKLNSIFEENKIDFEFPVIIRREINSKGRSRAFINDTPITLSIIKNLAELYLDIHTQHEILDLLKPSNQLSYLDDFCGNQSDLKSFRTLFYENESLKKQLHTLKEKEAKALKDKDYFNFLFDELNNANLKVNEESEIEEKLQLQENSEEIKKRLYEVSQAIQSESSSAIANQLALLVQQVKKTSSNYKPLKNIEERLQSVLIEVEDIASESELLESEISFDAEEKELLEERLNLLNTLFLKHQVNSSEELISVIETIDNNLSQIGNFETEIKNLTIKIELLGKELEKNASQISSIRKQKAENFIDSILKTAKLLGLENAKLKIEFTDKKQLSENGFDDIQIMFTANKGVGLKPIQKTASGGELSRLMLALKASLTGKNNLKTQLFDEIDSGVSGEVAHKFGQVFKNMGKNMQIIAITHLPQVAAQANYHYHISKEEIDNKTVSKIAMLNSDERILETAKLISSNKVTSISIENAKQLLSN